MLFGPCQLPQMGVGAPQPNGPWAFKELCNLLLLFAQLTLPQSFAQMPLSHDLDWMGLACSVPSESLSHSLYFQF